MHWREWIPETLKTLRMGHGLTQADLAKDCGLSVSYLSDIEVGRTVPILETLDRILQSYGLNITLSFFSGEYVPPGYAYVKRETLMQLADIASGNTAAIDEAVELLRVMAHRERKWKAERDALAAALAFYSDGIKFNGWDWIAPDDGTTAEDALAAVDKTAEGGE